MVASADNLARPYAKAVFELALAGQDFAAWQAQLDIVTDWVAHAEVKALLKHPRLTEKACLTLLQDALGMQLTPACTRLCQMLIARGRLAIMPAVAALFQQRVTEYQQTVRCTVTSAQPLDEGHKTRLAAVLAKQLQQKVDIQYEIDAQLMGGFVIRMGDAVRDQSVRGHLQRLGQQLLG